MQPAIPWSWLTADHDPHTTVRLARVLRPFDPASPLPNRGSGRPGGANTVPKYAGGLMIAVDGDRAARSDNDRMVDLRTAADLDNLALIRALVSAAATFEDLDLDTIADLRLAVDQACTLLIRAALPNSLLVIELCSTTELFVIDVSTTTDSEDVVSPGSFSWHVLSSLTDTLRVFQRPAHAGAHALNGISMAIRRPDL
jgi:hypothetical protein